MIVLLLRVPMKRGHVPPPGPRHVVHEAFHADALAEPPQRRRHRRCRRRGRRRAGNAGRRRPRHRRALRGQVRRRLSRHHARAAFGKYRRIVGRRRAVRDRGEILDGHGAEERLRGADGPRGVFRNEADLVVRVVLMMHLPLVGRDRRHGLRARVRASRRVGPGHVDAEALVLGGLDSGVVLIRIHRGMMLMLQHLLPGIGMRRLLRQLLQHLLPLLLTLLLLLLVSRREEMTEVLSRFDGYHLRLLRVGYVDVDAVRSGHHLASIPSFEIFRAVRIINETASDPGFSVPSE